MLLICEAGRVSWPRAHMVLDAAKYRVCMCPQSARARCTAMSACACLARPSRASWVCTLAMCSSACGCDRVYIWPVDKCCRRHCPHKTCPSTGVTTLPQSTQYTPQAGTAHRHARRRTRTQVRTRARTHARTHPGGDGQARGESARLDVAPILRNGTPHRYVHVCTQTWPCPPAQLARIPVGVTWWPPFRCK